VRLIFLFILLRVTIAAVAVLSVHKRLHPPVSTDCNCHSSHFCADAHDYLVCIQSDCYTRPDCAIIPSGDYQVAHVREQEMGQLCL
jgi:hypothetical protein